MENNTKKRMHATVEGMVQGVGFRFFVFQYAMDRGLKGWVRNRSSGEVEIMAEGSESDLEYLCRKLEVGPPAAQVTNVNVEWMDYKGDLSHFDVLSTL
ncbi:MAG TPA: acylphosphatase [Bacteroidetes bacterium]|nr:acylphosphatase [Bacteroidota bacterium]